MKLIPGLQPCQHTQFSTAFISYNSRSFVVKVQVGLVWRSLFVLRVYNPSGVLVKHFASQSAQTLMAEALL